MTSISYCVCTRVRTDYTIRTGILEARFGVTIYAPRLGVLLALAPLRLGLDMPLTPESPTDTSGATGTAVTGKMLV